MITSCYLYEAKGLDPHENLAVEQYILENLQPGQCVLYLWQNQNTVVIGRNQNPWVECRTTLLEDEGGILARRLSGGGAVFHDIGNLNFTFFMADDDFNIEKQLSVIRTACSLAGIETNSSGRNDVLAQGRKFSGNAFYHSRGNAYHHGTLLIHANMEKLQRYLSPSKAKLEAKGVSSVRSRVINLAELSPELTVPQMRKYMAVAFGQVYELPVQTMQLPKNADEEIAAIKKHIGSWEYLYGTPLPFTCKIEQQFPWGNVQLHIRAKGGIVQSLRMYTDAMDWHMPVIVEGALTGSRFDKNDMIMRIKTAILDPSICNDLCGMLLAQDL